jgi:excisionase family DNA binding protein
VTDWQNFVVTHGWGVRSHFLAAAVGRPEDDIEALRRRVRPTRGPHRTFPELFALFHGRPPRDEEWPAPRLSGNSGYEWFAPELALLASLVGRVGSDEIARVLTERLRQVTGDPSAERNINALNTARQRTGLWTADLVGGPTANQAGREIGCISIVYNDIRHGRLQAMRVGRHLMIPHAEWARWKAARVFPPTGYVSLSSLKQPLGITSDKLSEWARMGYVPSAIRCNPYGTRAASTKFGTWYIDPKVRKKLIADRRAGRPMPWWRKPEPSNLKITWTLWQERQHPAHCATCQGIWGAAGAPTTYEDYEQRYPPLAFGAKRHLTRPWFEGLSIREVAARVNLPVSTVAYAVRTGVLRAHRHGNRYVITRNDATRWKARNCPTGSGDRSWVQLATATSLYGFTRRELLAHIAAGRLCERIGTAGPQRGVRYVLKQQLRELRDAEGWPAAVAARRLGISVARLQTLAREADWRAADRFTLDVITTIRKRLDSEAGAPIREVANILGKSVAWVEREIANGTARVLRTPFKKQRRYISEPMFKRLCEAALKPTRRERWSSDWLLVSDAALLAGVSIGTVQRWADKGDVVFRMKTKYRRYHRRSVMTRARRYWDGEVRFKRLTPPAWLQAELARQADATEDVA